MLEENWDQEKYTECFLNFLKRQGREVLEDTLTFIPEYRATGEEDNEDCLIHEYRYHVFVKKIEGEEKQELFLEECRSWIKFIPKKQLTEVILVEN